MGRNVLVVTNGEWPSSLLVESLLEQADLVIACDGAANRLQKCDVVIGDMDSVSDGINFEKIRDESVMESDLTKALNKFPETTDIIGISGGRPDHVLGCMMSLVETKSQARAHFDGWALQYVEREKRFYLEEGKILSLFSIGESIGISISGTKFELDNETMISGTRGLHNEGLGKEVIITVKKGDVLIFIES